MTVACEVFSSSCTMDINVVAGARARRGGHSRFQLLYSDEKFLRPCSAGNQFVATPGSLLHTCPMPKIQSACVNPTLDCTWLRSARKV